MTCEQVVEAAWGDLGKTSVFKTKQTHPAIFYAELNDKDKKLYDRSIYYAYDYFSSLHGCIFLGTLISRYKIPPFDGIGS